MMDCTFLTFFFSKQQKYFWYRDMLQMNEHSRKYLSHSKTCSAFQSFVYYRTDRRTDNAITAVDGTAFGICVCFFWPRALISHLLKNLVDFVILYKMIRRTHNIYFLILYMYIYI